MKMQTYFARQPILDRNMDVYGYELLYRSAPHADSAGVIIDGDKATASIIEGFQVRGFDSITGGKKAFINFTRNLILDGVATFYPPESIIIEVLETTEPAADLIGALHDLKARGYKIALDDFTYRPALKPLLSLADIIKIDFLESSFTMRNFYAVCSHISLTKCTLLAEKVETQQVYEKALELGCKLFQGYFFAKPSTLSENTVEVMRMSALRLIAESSRRVVDFDAVADIIKHDIGLTYKILKLANSAFFGAIHEITDIKRAVVFIGQRELKKWVSFVALSDMNDSKPPELIEMSLLRAHFCEMTASAVGMPSESESFFLAGLFSLLDAMLNASFETIFSEMILPDITQSALLGSPGVLRDTLDLIVSIEQGKWEDCTRICDKLGVRSESMSEQYADSLQWIAELNNKL
jgi:EAL and modified HD-GYP domain-containing signal transduction protein